MERDVHRSVGGASIDGPSPTGKKVGEAFHVPQEVVEHSVRAKPVFDAVGEAAMSALPQLASGGEG